MSLIFVDCEAWGNCPTQGQLTEIGAVEFKSRKTFYTELIKTSPSMENSAIPARTRKLTSQEMIKNFVAFEVWLKQFEAAYIFVSDNPAFDWQWINCGFWDTLGYNPFGHSARRIGDFYAGLTNDFRNASKWKKLRITKHTHNPVDDAMGNVEAFDRILKGERG